MKKARARLPVLPSDPPARTIRKSRSSKWRAASLITIHAVIAAHIAHWLASGRSVTPVEPSEAMAFSKGGMINAGLIFFAVAILLTAVFGRFFCGWACHLVALQDLSRWLLLKVGIRPRPLRSRLLAWVPTLAFLYMFVWPAAWRLAHGDDPARVRGYELTTSAFWETFPGWIVGALTFLVCGFLCVYFLGAKGFCTYACPYGAAFAAAERLSPLRVRVTDACNGCGHCTAVCSSNVRVHEQVRDWGMVIDPGCMKTADCVSVCPNDALFLGFGGLPLAARRRTAETPSPRPALAWPEELLLGVAFAAAFFSFRGLYGAVPFLMALGVAGVLAFLVLVTWRLLSRDDFAWRRLRLREHGSLTGAGRLALGGAALLAVLWAHAALLRATAALADRDFDETAAARAAQLDVASPPPAPAPAERAALESALAGYRRLERWGPFAWRGVAPRQAALAFLAGDRSTFARARDAAAARGETTWELAVLSAREAAERGDLARTVAAGEQAIALAPDRPEGYAALAVLLAGAGRLDEAAQVVERGRARLPRSPDLAYDAGVVAAMAGLPEVAIAAFSRVLELDPSAGRARENLAGMLAAAGRFEESAAEFRRALDASPGDADLHVLRARALLGAGRPAEARAELERALALAPGHPEARSLLQEIPPAAAGFAR